jgi:hypothetical protein
VTRNDDDNNNNKSLAWQHFMSHSLNSYLFFEFPDIRIFTGWGFQPHDQPPTSRTMPQFLTELYPQALGNHFSRLLRHAFATLGLFLTSGRHTEGCL